jgi:cytochrome c-type biogenesis protein CcmF
VLDANGKVTEEFLLKPNAQANAKMGLIASPDTRHYLFSDLYTHVTYTNAMEIGEGTEAAGHDEANDDKKYEAPLTYEVAPGDTIRFREGYAILSSIGRIDKVQDITLTDKDVAIGAKLQIVANGKTYAAEPVYMIRNNNAFDFARKVDDAGLKLRFHQSIAAKR